MLRLVYIKQKSRHLPLFILRVSSSRRDITAPTTTMLTVSLEWTVTALSGIAPECDPSHRDPYHSALTPRSQELPSTAEAIRLPLFSAGMVPACIMP